MNGLVHSLETLYDEITAIALLTHTLEKEARALRNPYTDVHPLKAAARAFFGKEEASLKEMVGHLLAPWKEEKRLSANGRHVKLGKKEAKLLGLPEEQDVDVYEVYGRLQTLQKVKN